MEKFINKAINAGRSYSILDFALLKTSLISFGILLGAYFSQFFIGYISVVWIVFIVAYLLIMYKTFIKN